MMDCGSGEQRGASDAEARKACTRLADACRTECVPGLPKFR